MWYKENQEHLPEELKELATNIFKLHLKRDKIQKEIEELTEALQWKVYDYNEGI